MGVTVTDREDSRQAGGAGVTLVLGGGGFKGLAHIGVLQVLQQAGIPVERVVGTSAGALIGGMYCALGSVEAVAERAVSFTGSGEFLRHLPSLSRVNGDRPGSGLVGRLLSGIRRQVAFERMFRRPSAFGGAPLRHIVRSLVPMAQMEDLAIPLAICALNLVNGEEVVITSGDLVSAVVGSSAVPGFFPPTSRDGALLCDAGLVDNLPTRPARSLGATRVVAVDLSAGLAPSADGQVGLDVLFRSQDIATRLSNRRRSDFADVVLSPDLSHRSWLDAGNPVEVVAAGAAATEAALPSIVALLDERRGAPAPL